MDVFGRVRRAVQSVAQGRTVLACGVVHTYDPMLLGSALAVGMGAASVGAGAAMARDQSGRLVSATSVAIDRVTSWAGRDRLRYARLPHSVLAIVSPDDVRLYRWTLMGLGGHVATWKRSSYTATPSRTLTAHELRVVLEDGKIAVLSADNGPHHRGGRRALSQIAALARSSAS